MKLLSSLVGVVAALFIFRADVTDAAKRSPRWNSRTDVASADLTKRASASPKMVFAHFMVGIVASYQQADWANDIALASASGIDGFALNIGADSYTETQLTNAYNAAGRMIRTDFVNQIKNTF
jgi:hypothetical protein